MAIQSELDGRKRVVIEGVTPQVDGGRYAIKRAIGQTVMVEADIFVDGHDKLSCRLLYRSHDQETWREVAMKPLVNDRWCGSFQVDSVGRYYYTLSAWVDHFKSWRYELSRRVQRDDIALALQMGAELVRAASQRATSGDQAWLKSRADALVGKHDLEDRLQYALSEELAAMVERYPDRELATHFDKELAVIVDHQRARFSSWYELFPRSWGEAPDQHGTLKSCAAQLPRIAAMGFDVLYLPPIHPIGRIHRKGKNNTLDPGPDDVGSPWAIGSQEGGHKAIHPQLGTLEDFQALVAQAKQHGIAIALDIAFQCAPDHPYVKEHPSWFHWRPDGTVQYAENPPKKYQDIFPLNFETKDWQALWQELKSVFQFWSDQGVRIFRVDNPHTKPFPFWEWVISEIKQSQPDTIFLAEAFTRPKVMHRLAKLGFTQSYTYFTWRNTKYELTEYLTELTQGPGREYFRPNFWPNTPDILSQYLQFGGRPAFVVRLVLAATLSANYGIYGAAFELLENTPVKHGSEEYLNSEKYQVRAWNLSQPGNLSELIGRINHIRKISPALKQDWNLLFHDTDNEQIICYSKWNDKKTDIILGVVNLDAYHVQSGWITLDLVSLGIDAQRPFEVHDLLSDTHYLWNGTRNYVELNPQTIPAHIFRLHGRAHTEEDFDYFMG
jgi:starch synthase (maltosyl-transferring)